MSSKLIPIEAPDGKPSACSEIGVSRSTIYKEMNAGRLKSVKVGRRRFTTDAFIAEYVEKLVVDTDEADGACA
ncbi:MAG: helix-turn-helix domain-containing protein [Gordonia sp. (in: high G+C Gram-positive bacteria)]|uniref:helix-turn-helix transcriptional regulator n=1 Tax=Gordonia sp. (in: high G+C Gram-positive bacteria) TaxID=84139 RepID=UPI0039E38540